MAQPHIPQPYSIQLFDKARVTARYLQQHPAHRHQMHLPGAHTPCSIVNLLPLPLPLRRAILQGAALGGLCQQMAALQQKVDSLQVLTQPKMAHVSKAQEASVQLRRVSKARASPG